MVAWALDPETYSVTPSRRVISSSAETGVVLRRQTSTAVSADTNEASVRVWTLNWSLASLADAATIRGYLAETMGGAIPVDFTEPQAGASVKARILPGSFQVSSANQTHGVQMQVQLQEVL